MQISLIDSCNIRSHRLLRRFAEFDDSTALVLFDAQLRRNNLIDKTANISGLDKAMKRLYANIPKTMDIDIWRGYSLAPEAELITQAVFPESTGSDQGNAMKHCYWSAMMTVALGEKAAEKVGDYHETRYPGNFDQNGQLTPGSLQDLHNNAVGRRVALENDIWNFYGAWKVCREADERGELQYSNPNASSQHEPSQAQPIEPFRSRPSDNRGDDGSMVFSGDINIPESIMTTA